VAKRKPANACHHRRTCQEYRWRHSFVETVRARLWLRGHRLSVRDEATTRILQGRRFILVGLLPGASCHETQGVSTDQRLFRTRSQICDGSQEVATCPKTSCRRGQDRSQTGIPHEIHEQKPSRKTSDRWTRSSRYPPNNK